MDLHSAYCHDGTNCTIIIVLYFYQVFVPVSNGRSSNSQSVYYKGVSTYFQSSNENSYTFKIGAQLRLDVRSLGVLLRHGCMIFKNALHV